MVSRWCGASVNLYAGSTAAISFTDDLGHHIACTNTVASINLMPRTNPPGADFPAFSGGLWTNMDLACPGCSKVDWGDNAGINAQNIFLHPDWCSKLNFATAGTGETPSADRGQHCRRAGGRKRRQRWQEKAGAEECISATLIDQHQMKIRFRLVMGPEIYPPAGFGINL